MAVPIQAATLTVTGTGEPATVTTIDCVGLQCATLRGAINAATSGDTIHFDPLALDGQTIYLTLSTNNLSTGSTAFGPSAFFITGGKTLTIDASANGLSRGVVIARSGAAGIANFRLFDIDSSATLNLRGLTLRNGFALGGDSRFGGGALGAGGAIFNRGALNITRCALVLNAAQGGSTSGGSGSSGGGVGETPLAGGGNGGGPNGGLLGGGAFGAGGPGGIGGGGARGLDSGEGLYVGKGGLGGFGGGGGRGGNGSVAVGDGGGGGFGGGGGGHGYGTATGNSGQPGFGGASGTYLLGGAGAGMGGAIFNDAGTVTLTNVTLAENRASGGSSSSETSNGSGYGGAIFNYAGNLTLSFVTAANNRVNAGGSGGSAEGGALFNLSDTPANCSAGGNLCASGGTATLTISHSIGANSTGTTTDIVSRASYGDPSVFAPNASTRIGSVALAALPAPLRGGLVDVMVPLAGSSAIDAGGPGPCAVASDQRGVPRPQGAECDIGAVESETLFANGFEDMSVVMPLVNCTGMLHHTDVLAETFSGSALTPDWTVDVNAGAVNVADGVSASSSATTFPFVRSAASIIPTIGDFSVRWSARYTNLAPQGTGSLVVSNGLPANGTADSYALRSVDAWQDGSGFNVRARTNATTYKSVFVESPAQNIAHDVEYCWIDSQSMVEVWVDGVRTLQSPTTGLTRPTSLWFGNPVVAGTAWSSFKLDQVYVRSVSP
ncbi:MAG: hypothetical protein BGP25_13910 [Lysobacterales bacterium 63-13]|nr:MAG: hypothetical protein BGP25_13910 [Xanthomonadales bacterium 63-13]